MQLDLEYRHRPSVLASMGRAFHRAPPSDAAGGFPDLRLAWRDVRVDRGELAAFTALTGLGAQRWLPLLLPHVTGFRLLMALLTHPAWPLPIWRALQVRNHLVQRRPLAIGQPFDLLASVGDQRVLERGLEVDLRTQARTGDDVPWESLVTFYYRGRFGEPGVASPPAQAPRPPDEELGRWRAASGGGMRFGRLTGDYNPIHLWSPYARRLGFPRAFQHPQLVLAQSMARLAGIEPQQPQRLDAWLKGPVCYDAEVVLRGRSQPDGITFGVFADGDARPAVVGCWSASAPDASAPPGRA